MSPHTSDPYSRIGLIRVLYSVNILFCLNFFRNRDHANRDEAVKNYVIFYISLFSTTFFLYDPAKQNAKSVGGHYAGT